MADLRESARGQPCLIQIPGYCSNDVSKTVLCHFNGGGLALKNPDILGAFGCDSCHDVVDGRTKTNYRPELIELWFRRANELTIKYWINNNMISEV